MTHELEKLQRKGTERKQGHSKLVYDKATRTIKTIDPHPESNPTCPHCDATVLSTSPPEQVWDDPADVWEAYCAETPAKRRSPQGALAFGFHAALKELKND